MNPNLVKETQKTMDKAHKIVNIEIEQLQSLIDALRERIDHFQKQKQKLQVESDYFTTKELADYLQVTLPTVYKYVAKKEIPYIKLGRFVRFKKSDIKQWLADKQKHPTM
jgi:excisionase family DNA binding protein